MQDKDEMDIKDDKGKIKDEVGKLGGDKPLETEKPDLDEKDEVLSDKP